MEQAEWIWAAVALGSGLLFGEIAGRLVRHGLGRRSPSSSLAQAAGAIGSFVFWASTAVGLVIAIALVDPEVLDDLGARLTDSLPRFLVAFLLLIGGYAVSVAVSATVGQSVRKATGVRQNALERMLQGAIMAAAIVVALTELGVDSSMLVVLLVLVLGTPCLALGLLSALGGRDVAAQIAAGRSLRHRIREGQVLSVGDTEGTVIQMHPSTVEVELLDGTRRIIPNKVLLAGPFDLRTAPRDGRPH